MEARKKAESSIEGLMDDKRNQKKDQRMDNWIQYITWPLSILLLGIFFLLFFKKQISDFIDRTKPISKNGIMTDTHSILQKADSENDAQNNANKDQMAYGESPVFIELQENIRKDLIEKKLTKDSDKIDYLVGQLSTYFIRSDFEMIYRIIFGSQIFLLKKLNQSKPSGIFEDIIEKHFKYTQEKYPEVFQGWTVDSYLRFLFLRNLILKMEDGTFHITVKGIELLSWIIRMGYRDFKEF